VAVEQQKHRRYEVSFFRKTIRLLAGLIATGIAIVPVCVAILWARLQTRRQRPALFWGIAPLINIKFFSRAVKRQGYKSVTVVRDIYPINSRSDFDYLTTDLIIQFIGKRLPSSVRRLLGDYCTFLWAICQFDIFNFYFDGTILSNTPLKYVEMQLIKLAGKKTVFAAYGSDVQIISRFHSSLFKHAMNMDYPLYVRRQRKKLRNLEYYSHYADYIIAGADWVDYMPRWDKLVAGHFAIDTEEWKPCPYWTVPKSEKPVVVLHAPNHREIKGTRFLIQACEELRAEGVPVELEVIERVPHSRIHELIQACDIVADQFIIGWYALFAIEGMSMEKPVMAYLRPDLLELYTLYSYAGECPIVNTPPTKIKEVLKQLAEDPDLRLELGKKGRAYVLKYHSLEAAGKMFDQIYRKLWGDSQYI